MARAVNHGWRVGMRIMSERTDGSVTLTLSGSLSGPWIDELTRSFEAIAGTAPVIVDVSDVTFASGAGIAALRELVRRGARLDRCPPHLVVQLEGDQP